MNLLIRGADFTNKGAEAMLLTVVEQLSQRLPTAYFYASVARLSAEKSYAAGIHPLSSVPGTLGKARVLLKGVVRSGDVRATLKTNLLTASEIACFPRIDVLLDISGFAYSDEQAQGRNVARRSLAWAQHCRRHDVPVYYLPQAWGPFARPEIATDVRRMGETAAGLFARDPVSHDHLAKLMGGIDTSVEMATDIVFAFGGAPPAVGQRLLADFGLDRASGPIVALTPSLRVYERTEGRGTDNVYVRQMVEIGHHLFQAAGCQILILPHEFALPGTGRADDRFVAALIEMLLRQSGRCAYPSEPYPVAKTKAMLGAVDMVVGSRFHTLVLAAASGIPPVALGWTHKYRDLMRTIGLDNHFVEHHTYEASDVIALIANAWAARGESAAILARRIPQLKQDVASFFDTLAQSILTDTGTTPS